jgi:four helix bundle protein
MSSYKDLEIYRLAYALAIKIHRATLKLPPFELYEQGGQIRRLSQSIRNSVAEGFGRRKYKAEYLPYLAFSQASCDEATNQAQAINELYPAIEDFIEIINDLNIFGKKINNYIRFVETSWRT